MEKEITLQQYLALGGKLNNLPLTCIKLVGKSLKVSKILFHSKGLIFDEYELHTDKGVFYKQECEIICVVIMSLQDIYAA